VHPLGSFPAFYETRRLITVVTRALSLCLLEPDQSSSHLPYKIHVNVILPPASSSS
jgi:hypothetical protein